MKIWQIRNEIIIRMPVWVYQCILLGAGILVGVVFGDIIGILLRGLQ